jgi:transposase
MNYISSDISIGLDVSKKSISIYIPINKIDFEIENSIVGFKKLISKLKKLYKKRFIDLVFVYEPTGSYSELLRKFCYKRGIKSFIVNPKRSHNFAKANGNRNKSDKLDARLLSEAIVLAKKSEILVPIIDEAVNTIQELMSYYKLTVKQNSMFRNHLEAVSRKDGDIYIIKSLKKEISKFDKKEKEIIQNIKQIISNDKKLSDGYDNIISIIGVGEIGTIALIYLFIKYPDANKKQLTSLAGLDPIEFNSGTSINRKTKISKAGSKLYRSVLFMGVMSAVRFNPDMKIFYERLIDNHKHTTVAQVAVMRKILVIAHALYKNEKKYDSNFYRAQCGM